MPFTPKFVDLVRSSTSVQGTGPVNLGATVAGFTGLGAALTPGDQFYYCIQSIDKAVEREVGRGTMQANGTVARQAISGTLTNFTSGAKTIALVAAAEWFSRLDTLAVGGSPFDVASRTVLSAAGTGGARPAYLCESGRAGLFVFDPSNLSAKVAADSAQGLFIAPAAAPSGSAGAWVRQFDGALRLEWFGAVPGDFASGIGADCLGAWNACMAYIAANKRNVSAAFYGGAPEISFPGAQYYFSDTLQIKHTVRLRGMGSGGSGGEPTWLRFPADKAGIVVNRFSTLGDVAESPTTTGGDGSVIEGFLLHSAGGTPDLLKSGIRLRARAMIRDCLIRGFAGAGVTISADTSVAVSDPYHGNANNWRMDNVRAENNKCGGFYISGGDANAGVAVLCDASRNARYGIRDSAFLGNTWIGAHTDANGMYNTAGVVDTSVVTDGTHRYFLANGQEALAASTAPTTGTSNAVWLHMGLGGLHTNIPLYSPALVFASGGAYLQTGGSNFSKFDGCYYETGQAPPQILGGGIVDGGFMGSGLAGGAPHLVGSIGNGLQSQRPFTQRLTYTDASTATHGFGGDMSGSALDLLTWNSSVATPFNAAAKGALRQDKVSGDITLDQYGIGTPLFISGYSTARIYGGRTQATSRFKVELPSVMIGSGNTAIELTKGSAPPTVNFHSRGEMVLNDGTVTAISTTSYWRCSAAGTPGSWVPVGSLSSSVAIGYGTGAGGTAVQAASKSTGVTLNKACGQVTMNAASLAAGASVNFALINTLITPTEAVVVNIAGGATLDCYEVCVVQVTAGFCRIQLRNISAAALSEAVVVNFAVIKGVAA